MASLAGVLYAWSIGVVAPGTLDLASTVDLLVIAVIGGLARIEGAWLGAFVFFVIQTYVRNVSVPVLGGSFNTIIGFIFLAIVIVSPNGLMGLWDMFARYAFGGHGGGSSHPFHELRTAVSAATLRLKGGAPTRTQSRGETL